MSHSMQRQPEPTRKPKPKPEPMPEPEPELDPAGEIGLSSVSSQDAQASEALDAAAFSQVVSSEHEGAQYAEREPQPGRALQVDYNSELLLRANMFRDSEESAEQVRSVRQLAIRRLCDLIYNRLNTESATDKAETTFYRPEHDPRLRRRTEAVELLGRFPDREAADALVTLVRRGERDIPGSVGSWLRDTALLSLLSSKQLPAGAINRGLLRIYAIFSHLRFWHWSRVYDDLPWVARYRKLWVFFLGFWIWPLLIVAIPAVILSIQLINPDFYDPNTPTVDIYLGAFEAKIRPYDYLITYGSGLAIYLVHQVVIAIAASSFGPLLRVPGGAGLTWKMVVGVLIGAGVSVLLVRGLTILYAQPPCFRFIGSACGRELLWIAYIVPLLLPPMYILAHDLEQTIRYRRERTGSWPRAVSFLLRRTTDLFYLVALPILAGGVWATGTLRDAAFTYLMYLFATGFVIAILLRAASRLIDWLSTLPRGRGGSNSGAKATVTTRSPTPAEVKR